MGLRLPVYPYYAAQGMPGVKFDPASFFNRRAFEEMQQFADYLSEPSIRRIASNVIPPQGKQSIPTNGWFETAVFDEDDTDHKGLAALMAKVGKHRTILVPDLTHIMGKEEKRPPSAATRELMARFDVEDIEVLPLVLKLRGRRYDLRKFPKSFPRTHAPAPELFELMSEMARATVDYLQRAVTSGNGKRPTPRRRQLVPARPHV
ncbi:hypothetical protein [Bradyrhizobium sp.]|uniref:hypothetical protein n=1 Tax=Bradyrhizobium sp. TaxID=376 RepID=UPI001ED36790|nr:hypothetical protein [Bradyrhizobium sp.]MBV9978456.1 hypothetical protein [Bradyrhizobium sp.]